METQESRVGGSEPEAGMASRDVSSCRSRCLPDLEAVYMLPVSLILSFYSAFLYNLT